MEPQTNERTQHKQLIDENKVFSRNSIDSIAEMLKEAGKNYYTVAIIGVQNSGKSTLMNNVFGTKFPVLTGQSGQRTTKGIWTSLDQTENLIVMDVEGNDAMDRAQEQDYEKMVSTYALVMANVLLINIWCKSVGGYNGTQYETLKVILDISLQNFKQDCPKTILFCVRDFNEEYDDERSIRRTLNQGVNKIWRELDKSEEMMKYQEKPEKFFTTEAFFLRKYKKDKPELFREDADKLRKRFTDKKVDGYIFQNQKIDFNLPIKDLPVLAENSWKSVTSNQKLNLPGEKAQLARFRCSEISELIQEKFNKEVLELTSRKINYGGLLEKYMKEFDGQTYMYGKEIVTEKREELKSHMDEEIIKNILEEIEKQVDEIEKQFDKACSKMVENEENDLKVSLPDQADKLNHDKIDQFIVFMKELNYHIPNRKDRIEELGVKLSKRFKIFEKNTFTLIKNDFESTYSRELRLLASKLLKDYFGADFWKEAVGYFEEVKSAMISEYSQKYRWVSDTALDPLEIDRIQGKMENQFRHEIKVDLQKSLSNRIYDFFVGIMNKDDQGDERSFQLMQQSEIQQLFDETRDSSNLLIIQINEFKTRHSRASSIIEDVEQDNLLFESTWLSNASEQIDRRMIEEFQKIIRRKNEASMKKVPWWLFAIIIYFVYDDIWFTEAEHPFIHYSLTVLLCFVLVIFAIGKGSLVLNLVSWVAERIPFMN